jgi:hypothetical protein
MAISAIVACDKTHDGQESQVNQLLDQYTPGLRIGERVADAKRKTGDLYFAEGGSTNYTDSTIAGTDGFSWLVVRLAVPASDTPPPDDAKISALNVWSVDSNSHGRAITRLQSMMGSPGDTGCMMPSGSKSPLTQVALWRRGSLGVALEQPSDRSVGWSARLTFFDASQSTTEIFGMELRKSCQ